MGDWLGAEVSLLPAMAGHAFVGLRDGEPLDGCGIGHMLSDLPRHPNILRVKRVC